MESTVQVERRDGGILLIGINRPEANNRIDPPTYVALGQALYELEHDDELRVGVLHAIGPDFVPALDLAAYGAAAMAGTFPAANPRTLRPTLFNIETPELAHALRHRLHHFIRGLDDLRIHFVGALRGDQLGDFLDGVDV